jgi:hypothetical protein
MKKFIKSAAIFSFLPVAAIILLHMTIKKSNGVNRDFQRSYFGTFAKIKSEMNNPGLITFKSFNGKVYAGSYNDVSTIDLVYG